ncbi:MAG: hypothetical protein ACREOB_10505, partial [Thermodesulfobacteriota bacterium]
MSDEEKKNKTSLVSSASRGLATRSSGLARRGLELLSSNQERVIYFPTDRSIGVLYVLGEENEWIRIDARGNVTLPPGRKLGFDDGTETLVDHIKQTLVDNKSGKTRIYDSDLVCLRELAELEWLWLSGSQITDAGLAYLTGMTKLKELSLTSTKISDAGLIHLQWLAELESLWLPGNQITDTGLAYLKSMTKVKELVLQATRISDSGLI